MITTAFIAIYGSLGIIFCALIFYKRKQYVSLLPVALVAVLAPVHGLIAQEITSFFDAAFGVDLICWFFLCAIAILWGILETIYALFRPTVTKSILLTSNLEKYPVVFSVWPWRILALTAAVIAISFPGHQLLIAPDQSVSYLIGRTDKLLFCIRLLMAIAILFAVENIYRYAPQHAKRSSRASFLAFAILAGFDAIFSIRVLLFSMLSQKYIEASLIAYGVCTAAGLFGLIRYRMSEEKIVISRAGIYSSLTFFLAGALLIALGITVAIIQKFGQRFSYFEEFVAVFSAIVFGVIAATSQWMRLRVARFVNRHFYRRKYDYRDQFFNLHMTYMAGEHLSDSVNILLENLTHSLAIGQTFVFLRNQRDGNFYLHRNHDTRPVDTTEIAGGSPLIAVFENSEISHLAAGGGFSLQDAPGDAEAYSIVKELRFDAVFPIKNQKTLVGLLAIRKMHNKVLDEEDIELVKVFAVSIGNVYFKYRMLEERLEMKQFESFHHISSFIIHDIKNQVATLSLLTRNADSNMGNPEFQKSLVRSITNCSDNLQSLVDKLSMPARHRELSRVSHDVNGTVREVIDQAGLGMIASLVLEVRTTATKQALFDREAFSFIVRNLVINALEAMKNSGTLTIATGDIDAMPSDVSRAFGIASPALSGNSIYVLVKDTGPGMSRDFIENKLFRPFSSTKDKGIGIGLYQSRMLIDKMGGRLLCISKEGEGTQFCCII